MTPRAMRRESPRVLPGMCAGRALSSANSGVARILSRKGFAAAPPCSMIRARRDAMGLRHCPVCSKRISRSISWYLCSVRMTLSRGLGSARAISLAVFRRTCALFVRSPGQMDALLRRFWSCARQRFCLSRLWLQLARTMRPQLSDRMSWRRSIGRLRTNAERSFLMPLRSFALVV